MTKCNGSDGLSYLALAGICLLAGLAACAIKKAPPPKLRDPGYDTQTLSHITKPEFSLNDHILTVSTADGFSASVDLRELLDVDNHLRPVGDSPNEEFNATCVEAAIKAPFEMGYYDLARKHSMDINTLISNFNLSTPIFDEYTNPAYRGEGSVDILLLKNRDLVAGILEGEYSPELPGFKYGMGILSAPMGDNSKLPTVEEEFPSLDATGAADALTAVVPGYSAQALKGEVLVRKWLQVKHRAGLLPFFWVPKKGDSDYLVNPDGGVYRAQTGESVQSLLQSRETNIRLRLIGRFRR